MDTRDRRSLKPLGHLLRDESGASAITVAIMLIVFLGLAAVAVDAGLLYSERRAMQTAADAAALAGVQELPGDPAAAIAIAEQYAVLNEPQATSNTYEVKSTYATNDTLVATLTNPARGLYFARFLGVDTAPVEAMAAAVVGSPSAYINVMPFGIMSKEPSGTAPFGYAFNELVVLKQSPPDGEAGNFQFLALTYPPGGHFGNNDIKDALANGGVADPVFIDTLYNTKTGVNGLTVSKYLNEWIGDDTCAFEDVASLDASGAAQILDWDCHRLIICPIIVDPGPPVVYNWFDLPGTSEPVLVIGFAYFYIEDVGTSGADCWVSGRFIKPVGSDDAVEWGAIDPYGPIGFRLVQ